VDDWLIEPFGKQHDRATFTCGNAALDEFLHTRVSQYEKRHIGKTFVLVKSNEPAIRGFYTLAAGAISFEHLPAKSSKKLPKHPVPVVLLARLAVDATVQGQRLGERLLLDALRRSLGLSQTLGIHAVEVDAIDDAATQFYVKYGFTSLNDDSHHLYLPIATIESIF